MVQAGVVGWIVPFLRSVLIFVCSVWLTEVLLRRRWWISAEEVVLFVQAGAVRWMVLFLCSVLIFAACFAGKGPLKRVLVVPHDFCSSFYIFILLVLGW